METTYHYGIQALLERDTKRSAGGESVANGACGRGGDTTTSQRYSNDGCATKMSYPRGLESQGWPAKWPWLPRHWSRDARATFPFAFKLRIRTLVLCLKVTRANELPGDIVDLIVRHAATTLQLW